MNSNGNILVVKDDCAIAQSLKLNNKPHKRIVFCFLKKLSMFSSLNLHPDAFHQTSALFQLPIRKQGNCDAHSQK